MGTLIQLHEAIEVETPLGYGTVLFVESGERDLWWTVALESRAVVTFPQRKIRVERSYTHGHGISDEEMRRIIATATGGKSKNRSSGKALPKIASRPPRSMSRLLRKPV